MTLKNSAEVLVELDPPEVAWERLLMEHPENCDSVLSLFPMKRPTDVIARGRWGFVRGLGGYTKEAPFIEVYRSKTYRNPTYRDAWIEFKLAQAEVRAYLGGDFNSVFLEDVVTAAQYSKKPYGPKGNWLHFGVGS